MLENIKLMLGLTDSDKDELILLYMAKVETDVVAYCNLREFDPKLNSFVENKVVQIMNPNAQVKSISRGDTNITYNINTEYSIGLTDSDKTYLNGFRRCSLW